MLVKLYGYVCKSAVCCTGLILIFVTSINQFYLLSITVNHKDDDCEERVFLLAVKYGDTRYQGRSYL